jgi:hypothetical protein
MQSNKTFFFKECIKTLRKTWFFKKTFKNNPSPTALGLNITTI